MLASPPRRLARQPSSPLQADDVENTFFDSIQIQELSLPGWRTIFGAIGYPVGLNERGLTHAAIEQALVGKLLSADLVDALQVNADLGNEPGQELIATAVADVGLDTRAWPRDERPRDLVARLWVEQRSNPEVMKVLDRALMCANGAVAEGRKYREFAGKEPRVVSEPGGHRQALRRELLAWCKESDRGDYADVRVCEVSGKVFFEFLHGHRMQSQVIVKARRRAVIEIRPAHSDSVRYDPTTARLGISAKSAPATRFYRRAIGKVLFDDPDFFAGENICTLKPLQLRGREALSPRDLDPRIFQVRLVECVWRRDEDEQIKISAKDCFVAAQRMQLSMKEGELLEAVLELMIEGGRRPRQKRIVIRVPNQANVPRDRDEVLVEEFLKQVGIKPRGLIVDEVEGLWSLHPWTHSASRWKAAFGSDVDRMVEQGLLKPVARGRAEHPGYPATPAPLREVRLPDGERFGVSEDGDVPSRTLTASDLEGLRLDVAALAREIGSALGTRGKPQEIGNTGVFNVGIREFPGASIRVFLVSRAPVDPSALAAQLTSTAASAKPVLIVPDGSARTGLTEIDLGAPCGPFKRLLRPIIEEVKLHAFLPAIDYAPPEARLIVDRLHGKAWLDGVLLLIQPATHPFELLALLAGARGSVLTREKIIEELESEDDDPDTAARKLKKRTLDSIKASFSKVNRDLPPDLEDIIVGRGGGYALSIPAYLA